MLGPRSEAEPNHPKKQPRRVGTPGLLCIWVLSADLCHYAKADGSSFLARTQ